MKQIDQIENNSVICFLGDSITASGLWESEIASYLASHHREKHLKLFTCGIGGDNSGSCLKRVYRDCLSFHPDYVVLMLGMNDINITLYREDTDENLEQRMRNIEKHKENMTMLIDTILRNRVKLILCTPTICGTVPNHKPEMGDFSPGLEACAEFAREQAAKHGCMLVDFNKALWDYTNLQEPIIAEDCVHPTPYGYHIMAQVFMMQIGIKDTVDTEPYVETNRKNEERFQLERIITSIRFCELAMQWSGLEPSSMTIEERKNWIRKNATVENASYWDPERTGVYLQAVDYRDDYMARLVQLTNDLYYE